MLARNRRLHDQDSIVLEKLLVKGQLQRMPVELACGDRSWRDDDYAKQPQQQPQQQISSRSAVVDIQVYHSTSVVFSRSETVLRKMASGRLFRSSSKIHILV